MKLIFQGGPELVTMVIDRDNKHLQVASSLTNYGFQVLPWSYLFDKGKEKLQERVTDELNDEGFVEVIIAAMAQQGYVLKKRGEDA